MNYRILIAIFIFCITCSSVFAKQSDEVPYSVKELESNYRFYPFRGLNNHGLNERRLKAGIGGGDLLDMWSRLTLAKLYQVDELEHLKAAYALSNQLGTNRNLTGYICYELANYYSTRYFNSFARVYAGKGLTLAEEGSYVWLLNWNEYSTDLSDATFIAPFENWFKKDLINRKIEEDIVLLAVIKERADMVWMMERLNYLSNKIEEVSPYFQMIYYRSRLDTDRKIEEISIESKNSVNDFLRVIEYLSEDLSEQDLISNKLSLARRAVVDGEYMAALNYTKHALEISNKSISENKEKSTYDLINNYNIKTSYANRLLFLTRLGKGLDPVKEAFEIYEDIESKTLSLLAKNTTRYDFLESFEATSTANMLIIGGYLYQKTGDVNYLSKGLSSLDLVRSTILYAQANKTEKAKLFAFGSSLESSWVKAMRSLSLTKSDFDYLIEMATEYEEQLKRKENITSFNPENIIEHQPIIKVSEQLDDSSALVYFAQQKTLIISVLVLKDTLCHRYYNSSIANINREIEKLVTLSAKPDLSINEASEVTAISRSIYKELLRDYEADLPRNIEIITSGSLDGIPFGLLRMDSTGNQPVYFGDEHTLSYSYSLRTRNALRSRPKKAPRQQILGMAPMFNGPILLSSRSGDSTRQVGALANNQDEVEFIEAAIPGRFIYDESATRSNFESQASDYSVIHLATHAEANAANGNMSRIYFAGAEDENVLHAYELADIELQAEMVVLSACETGTGARKGFEGRVGLSQAFIAAGANSVLSTRWAVDDRATAEIMADFYKQIEVGATKDKALQEAQRAYRLRHAGTRRADPYYWAAFDLIGNTSPIEFKGDFHYNWWKWAIGGLAFLILIGSTKKR
ncbi:MAG: CHAT domain-containing protein [Bacteroidota bacterium]